MHPISLLYFVHSLKLAIQFSVFIITLFDEFSRVVTILAAFVPPLAVFPLGHISAPILAPENYAVGLDPLFFLVYICLCVVLGAFWYSSVHNSHLLFFILVTITDTVISVLFVWVRMRGHVPRQALSREGRLEAGVVGTRERDRGGIQNVWSGVQAHNAENGQPTDNEGHSRQDNEDDNVYDNQSRGNEHEHYGLQNDPVISAIPQSGIERVTGYNAGGRPRQRMPREVLPFITPPSLAVQERTGVASVLGPPIQLHPMFRTDAAGTRVVNIGPAARVPVQQAYGGSSSQQAVSTTFLDSEEEGDGGESQRV